ncbi:MAG TPA: carbohydrate kinase family protein, partial [Nitrososphaerales archaeon]|nr:carbohydrate kinase family protein [Nitrososphaerales archaeon]
MAPSFDVAVMHDFFVDRLVHVKSMSGMTRMLSEKAAAGGGGLHGIQQEEVRGGNAVNLAHALARLGLRTLLITHAGRTHMPLLQRTFEGLKAELRIKPLPAGLTVAFEEKLNVMIGDTRGASDFGPSLLDESDWRALENSRLVCSVNWAANRRGTELLVALRSRLGSEKTIFFDPADFRDRVPQFRKLLGQIADKHLVDWVSMNEQEGIASAKALGIESSDLGKMCIELAQRLGVVFDLHAVGRSYSSEGTRLASAIVVKARSRRLTGAGDVWDAGAILGRLKGLEEVPRLRLANKAARLYLESEG